MPRVQLEELDPLERQASLEIKVSLETRAQLVLRETPDTVDQQDSSEHRVTRDQLV